MQRLPKRSVSLVLFAFVASVLGAAVFANAASAATPTYVVAGDDPNATGDQWGLHEAYFNDLRAVITDRANFGPTGTVNATFTIAAPRAVPLTAHSLDGIDVYFTSARDIASSETTVLNAFVARGGTLIMNANGPFFFDDTLWWPTNPGFRLSPRVVFGDGAAPYGTTHQAPSPSTVVAAQSKHPIFSGPFGTVTTFNNWHTVAGWTSVPANSTVLSRTTLTGPDNNGSSNFITISNVATFAVIPAGTISAGSGAVIATSDVDTFSNAYTFAIGTPAAIGYPTDNRCTLFATSVGPTGNGILARNTFAWIVAQKTATPPTGTTTSTTPPTTTKPVATSTTTTTTKVPVTTTTTRRRRG